MKLLIYSSLLTVAKWFATAKKKAHCNEERDELKTTLGSS